MAWVYSMIYSKTLRNIREAHRLSQAGLADLLGVTEEHIEALESGLEQADIAFVEKLKDRLTLHGTPILESARTELMEQLFLWKHAIDYADIDKANELQPELEKAAKSSYSPSAMNFYDIFEADYYRLINDMPAYEKAIANLSQRHDTFAIRQQYYYHVLMGAKAFVEKRYQDAINAYRTAEWLDTANQWHGVRFYFGLGVSLTDRGYATRAIWYLEKAKRASKRIRAYCDKPNRRFDVYIDGVLTYNLSKVGRHEEAIKILYERLGRETRRKSKRGIGYTHFSFGRVYNEAGEYNKAIESYNEALKYLDKEDDAYIANLYHKAALLFVCNKHEDAVICAEEALSVVTDEYWKVQFDAIRCSASMYDDSKHVIYLIETVMPKLQEYDIHKTMVYFYQRLATYFYESDNIRDAYLCCNLALETQIQLYKELVEGDM